MRVLVCGGRDYADRARVFATLDQVAGVSDEQHLGSPDLIIIHGRCPTGADHHADQWAATNWTRVIDFPADWRAHGKAAGPIRNQQMIDEGKPDLVVAFPGGRGTADMVRRARAAGIEVMEAA